MDHTLNHTWKSQIPYPKLKSVWSSCQHTPNQALFLPPPTSHPPSSPALFRRPSCVVRGDHWLSHLSRVLIRHNPSQGFERRDPPAVPVCPDTTLSGTGIYIYIPDRSGQGWWCLGGSMGRQSYGSPMECLGSIAQFWAPRAPTHRAAGVWDGRTPKTQLATGSTPRPTQFTLAALKCVFLGSFEGPWRVVVEDVARYG